MFATKAFHKGDALIHYTGKRFDNESHLRRVQRRPHSPYAVMYRTSKVNEILDASCERSLAAYANAPARGTAANRSNVAFVQCTLNDSDRKNIGTQRLAGGTDDRWMVPAKNHLKSKFRSFPLGVASQVEGPHVWLRASGPILPGDEILVNYGGNTKNILEISHKTSPPLCKLMRRGA